MLEKRGIYSPEITLYTVVSQAIHCTETLEVATAFLLKKGIRLNAQFGLISNEKLHWMSC
jgi:hypothetical protein